MLEQCYNVITINKKEVLVMTSVRIVYTNKSYQQPKARIIHKLPEVKVEPSKNPTLKIPKYVELP